MMYLDKNIVDKVNKMDMDELRELEYYIEQRKQELKGGGKMTIYRSSEGWYDWRLTIEEAREDLLNWMKTAKNSELTDYMRIEVREIYVNELKEYVE